MPKNKREGMNTLATTCVQFLVSPENVNLSIINAVKQNKIQITKGETNAEQRYAAD
jgi:hypothetical protein